LSKRLLPPLDGQTLIFLLPRVYPNEAGARADLLDATVLMNRGMGFDPNRRDDRLAEIARLGLMNRRAVVRDEIEKCFAESLRTRCWECSARISYFPPSQTRKKAPWMKS